MTLLLTASLTIMAGANIAPSLPALYEHFAATPNAALLSRLVLTVTPLGVAFFAPICGFVADRFGRRKLLLFAVFCFALTGASGLYLDSLATIIIGRALLGISAAAIMTVTVTLVGDYFSGNYRDRFLGLKSAAIGFGGVVFLTIGGYLADVHWRAAFSVYLLAFLILPFILANLFEPERGRAAAEGAGKARPPEVPLARIGAIYGVAMFTMIVFYVIPVQLPFYLREIGIVDPSRAGLAIATSMLTSALLSLFYGGIRRRLSFDTIFVLVFACFALGFGVIAVADGYGLILVGAAISGCGVGAAMPNVMAWLLAVARPEIRGRLVGGLTTFIFLGQFLSPIAMQPVIGNFGLAPGFVFAASMAGLIALLFAAAVLRRRSRRPPGMSVDERI